MRTIKIKSKGVGRYDNVSPFLVTDNQLQLQIVLPHFNGEFYFVAENNGKSFRKLIPADGLVVLSDLTAGELKAEVKHYVRGELVEVYKVEPLLLKEVDMALSAMPEIALLTGEIEALKEELATLKQTVQDNLTATQEGFKGVTDWQRESDRAFLSFSYAVYQNSPLLNGKGLSFAQFAETLGFEGIDKIELGEKL